ncbi:MAG: hypothetical protein K5981_08810 [Clostridia bacterium]|nr:hypothetical protein [Clostridia bacterium]
MAAKETKIVIPDNVMSTITTKELLEKWTLGAVNEITAAVRAYHFKSKNPEENTVAAVRQLFADVSERLRVTGAYIKDLTAFPIENMYDTIIAVFGIVSPQVYIYKSFMQLYKTQSTWTEETMWDECAGNEQLKKVLGR